MDKETGMVVIIGACLMVLILVTMKNKLEFILNFCLRVVTGGIAIFGINALMEMCGFSVRVGVNMVSLLVSGVLGFSGVSLLYAIAAF